MRSRAIQPFCLRAGPAHNGDFARSGGVRAKTSRYDSIAAALLIGRAVLILRKVPKTVAAFFNKTLALIRVTFAADALPEAGLPVAVFHTQASGAYQARRGFVVPTEPGHPGSRKATASAATEYDRRDCLKTAPSIARENLLAGPARTDCPCPSGLHGHRPRRFENLPRTRWNIFPPLPRGGRLGAKDDPKSGGDKQPVRRHFCLCPRRCQSADRCVTKSAHLRRIGFTVSSSTICANVTPRGANPQIAPGKADPLARRHVSRDFAAPLQAAVLGAAMGLSAQLAGWAAAQSDLEKLESANV